ncbi:MAG: hydrogenase formation protein HypD, partial [Bacteroidota bacterium]
TGFEPVDILQGILMTVRQLEAGVAKLENQYSRVVKADGNPHAKEVIHTIFEPGDRAWRGIGIIPQSGYELRPDYSRYDADRKFDIQVVPVEEPKECMAGQVLKGIIKPQECPAFGKKCTPRNPLGAPMVSSEGACAAYYNFSHTIRQLEEASI